MQTQDSTLTLDPQPTPPSPAPLPPQPPKSQQQFSLPTNWQQWVRPMVLISAGLHALILFVPLTASNKPQPKEKEPPVKLSRLSDKVLVKTLPKVTDAAKAKPALAKVKVTSTSPIVLKETPKPEPEKKTEPQPKTPETKPSTPPANTPATSSTEGADPSKVDPNKATTDKNEASQLDAESQKFSDVIVGLRKALNPGEENEPEVDPYLLPDPTQFFPNPDDPTQVVGGILGKSWISNTDVESVASSLANQFPGGFAKQGTYGGGEMFEAKLGTTVRYVSLVNVNSGSGVIVFLWNKSPV
ncbi:hypothetical protein [Alkalinema sp. FACHB-956]|uniref:hypothetical protein n=1 Tax=Alkalinema sp. FACHB-956 TaxID=2692768 RepID=UPI001687E877|nr:hypothetical protein [Alkalinema sp. FACHB-956]MBD2326467.1 hypothetical protein [Alkalinema sp. FACHB-956]